MLKHGTSRPGSAHLRLLSCPASPNCVSSQGNRPPDYPGVAGFIGGEIDTRGMMLIFFETKKPVIIKDMP